MKKRVPSAKPIPGFEASISSMPDEDKLFVDKSFEIANYIQKVMKDKGLRQKDLAEMMGKSEAEVSKLLGGMHNYTLRSISKIEAALQTSILQTPRKADFSWKSAAKQASSLPLLFLVKLEHKIGHPAASLQKHIHSGFVMNSKKSFLELS